MCRTLRNSMLPVSSLINFPTKNPTLEMEYSVDRHSPDFHKRKCRYNSCNFDESKMAEPGSYGRVITYAY